MVLEIALGVVTLLTTKTVIKTVIENRKLTRGLSKTDRRTLLWRYGPFRLDKHTVKQFKKASIIEIEIDDDHNVANL